MNNTNMARKDDFIPLSKEVIDNILSFDPKEKLGQNFLVEPLAVRTFVNQTIRGAKVVEIGTGPGNLTKGIASLAEEVTGLEICHDFADSQAIILESVPNVKIKFIDALRFNFAEWSSSTGNRDDSQHQVMGSIPFHISEPLLTKLAKLYKDIDNITLVVGDNLSNILNETNAHTDRYSRLSFIGSIFDIEHLTHLSKRDFWPIPRTDADILSLTPQKNAKDGKDIALFVRRQIVSSGDLTIAKVLKGCAFDSNEGKVRSKDTSHRYERRQTRAELKKLMYVVNEIPITRRDQALASSPRTDTLVSRLNLPNSILSKPFNQLNNEEVRTLASSINSL